MIEVGKVYIAKDGIFKGDEICVVSMKTNGDIMCRNLSRWSIHDKLTCWKPDELTLEKEVKVYLELREKLIDRGYKEEIEWCENVKKCQDMYEFLSQYIWVVLNSGMRNQTAQKIADKVYTALANFVDINTVFGHKGKCKAINYVTDNLEDIYAIINAGADERYMIIEYLESLPYIGKITKYHLARNLGYDFCKPDRHLIRIAKLYNMNPFQLCNKIASRTGDRIGVVDVVLWRSANLGLI